MNATILICPNCKIPIRQENMPEGKVSTYCTACSTEWSDVFEMSATMKKESETLPN